MSNLATAFKDEMTRLARKQLRPETDALRKAVTSQRSEIAALKRRLHALERAIAGIGKAQRAAAPKDEEHSEGGRKVRFSAQGLARERQRLGISAADFGRLVGASGLSIYAWEKGKTSPRPQNVAAIAALRGVGKKEVTKRLALLDEANA